MTQLTLDQRMKEADRQRAIDRYRYAPHGKKNERQARAIAATCAALASDPVVSEALKGKRDVV